jgi:hypothetical protein
MRSVAPIRYYGGKGNMVAKLPCGGKGEQPGCKFIRGGGG